MLSGGQHDDHSNFLLRWRAGAGHPNRSQCFQLCRATLLQVVGDKYINLKTGKQVKPPKAIVAPLDTGVTEAKPKPAAPPDPYYRLADRYYGYSDPFRGYYDYHALPPLNPGYGYVRPLWR